MHRTINDLASLLNDHIFYNRIMETLEAWNMNQRGAELTSVDNFKKSVSPLKTDLIELYKYKLHSAVEEQINNRIKRLLKNVFSNLKVMESKRRIVGVSKALHFLLPDLVVPIDSKYTLSFFYGYNKYSDNAEEEFKTFEEIFTKAYDVTKNIRLTQDDVSGEGWDTSMPKLIDNAIIGFFKYIDNYSPAGAQTLIKEMIDKDYNDFS